MKRKIAFGFIVTCSIALNIAFIAMWLMHSAPRFTKHQRVCGIENGGCRKCPLHEALELSDNQWSALKPSVETYRRIADSLRHEITAAREAMLIELSKTPTDTAAVAICSERVLDGQRKMHEMTVANVLKQKKVLTSGQHRRFIEKVRSDMSCTGGRGMTGAPFEKECGRR